MHSVRVWQAPAACVLSMDCQMCVQGDADDGGAPAAAQNHAQLPAGALEEFEREVQVADEVVGFEGFGHGTSCGDTRR